MGDKLAAGQARPRYPLVVDRVQASIMAHVHSEAKPVSRAQLTGALNTNRGKISAQVARLIEAGLLAKEGLAKSGGDEGRPWSASHARPG